MGYVPNLGVIYIEWLRRLNVMVPRFLNISPFLYSQKKTNMSKKKCLVRQAFPFKMLPFQEATFVAKSPRGFPVILLESMSPFRIDRITNIHHPVVNKKIHRKNWFEEQDFHVFFLSFLPQGKFCRPVKSLKTFDPKCHHLFGGRGGIFCTSPCMARLTHLLQ